MRSRYLLRLSTTPESVTGVTSFRLFVLCCGRSALSAGSLLGECLPLVDTEDRLQVRFGPGPLPRVGLLVLTTVQACIRRLTMAAWLGMVAQRVCTPVPFIPASGIDGGSLPRGMRISSIHQEGQGFAPVNEQPVVIPNGMPLIPRQNATVSRERIAPTKTPSMTMPMTDFGGGEPGLQGVEAELHEEHAPVNSLEVYPRRVGGIL